MAAPVFRNATAVRGISPTFNKPTGLADGDLLIATTHTLSAGVITPPSGFTLINDSGSSTTPRTRIYSKPITSAATEPSTYTFSGTAFSSASNSFLTCYISATVDVTTTFIHSSSTTMQADTVTTTGPNRTICLVFASASASSMNTPTGYASEASDISGTNYSLLVVDKTQATAGATGLVTTTSGTAGTSSSATIALYTPTINISLSRILKWNVASALSLSRILKWNVKATLTDVNILKWNVAIPLSTSRVFKWNVRLPVTPITRVLKWNVKASLTVPRVFKWNVRAVLSISRVLKWNVRVEVIPITRTFLWRVFSGWHRVPTHPDIWTPINENDATWTPEAVNSTSWVE